MLSLDLARRLRAAGLAWLPIPGDRFIVPDRDMDDDVFVISDMTVDVHDLPTGQVIGFNGTTEWALDSIESEAVIWLPREEQMRELLDQRFVALEVVAGGYAVVTEQDGARTREVDLDAERAYARALLGMLDTQNQGG